MAPTRNLDSRWIRRYRTFFVVGSVILSIQVFLAYRLFPIDAEGVESAQEHRDLSEKGLNIEVSIFDIYTYTHTHIYANKFNITVPLLSIIYFYVR
jgi:hypothetical protein